MNHMFSPRLPNLALTVYDSPIGYLTLAARSGALVGVWARGQRFFGCPVGIDEAVAASLEILPSRAGSGGEPRGVTGEDAVALTAAASWLEQYFAGENPSPARLHITPEGTHFQKHVWEAMGSDPLRTHTHLLPDCGSAARGRGRGLAPRGRRGRWPQSPAYRPPLPPRGGCWRTWRLRSRGRGQSLAVRARSGHSLVYRLTQPFARAGPADSVATASPL